jgi:hypothetical protein
MATASGTIFRSGGKERISHATIAATKGEKTVYATSGEDGDFSLEVPEAGAWMFTAMEKGSYASSPLKVEMDQDQTGLKIHLDRIGESSDDKAGRTFFWVLMILLGVLIVGYLLAHMYLVEAGQGFSIWTKDPLRYLEILLWGLAGILVSKIITTGWYLRSHRFYREGMLMHIAHLVATPLMVLVIVLLLSQVTLKFTLANSNDITIDLSIPTIMVAFSFIIGTSPWPLWNFILNTAKRFTGQLE